jgi:hypothetical protein
LTRAEPDFAGQHIAQGVAATLIVSETELVWAARAERADLSCPIPVGVTKERDPGSRDIDDQGRIRCCLARESDGRVVGKHHVAAEYLAEARRALLSVERWRDNDRCQRKGSKLGESWHFADLFARESAGA